MSRSATLQDLTRVNKKLPEMKGNCGPQGAWPPGVVCGRICGLRGRNSKQERLETALGATSTPHWNAAAPAVATFEENAQRIGIHDSGDDRAVQRLLLTYWSSSSSDRSLDAIATRKGENANPCTPLNPVAMGVTTPVFRSTRPTSFTTFAAV